MKKGNLKSLGHNLADSLASGMGFMIGVYQTDIFREASLGNEGYILVDFLSATASGSPVSSSLLGAIKLYRSVLPEFCKKHNIDIDDIQVLEARFSTDRVFGPHFTVSVESSDGKGSIDQYYGFPGERFCKRHKQATQ